MVKEITVDETPDVRGKAVPMTLPARRTKPGGLVARRLELFDSPMHGEKKGYVHRQQDSFHPSSLHPVVEARDEETRDRPDRYERSDKVDSRAMSENTSATSPPPKLPRDYPGSDLIETGVNNYTKGEYGVALQAFTEALKTQRDCFHRGDDIFVALTLGNLGAVYLQQGNFVEAERVLQESLEIKKRLAPSMLMADTLNNLGNCANMRGDYTNSCLYYEEALEEIRSKNGPRVDEINALFNIGRLEIQREHWTKAMISLSEACRMAKEHYGSNSEFVGMSYEGFCMLVFGLKSLSSDLTQNGI